MAGQPTDHDDILLRFNQLIRELLQGGTSREMFQPWEFELLLDIEKCRMRESTRRNTLRRYQQVVRRQIQKGAATPMKLSEFLSRERRAKPPVRERQ